MSPSLSHAQCRPIVIVRLPNWIGDVVLLLPALVQLARLADLQLLGRRWAPDLLADYGWPCHVYPKRILDRINLIRKLKNLRTDAFGLCVPTSFSSALEFRLAGLPALGCAREGRSWLLKRALPFDDSIHMREHYRRLIKALHTQLSGQETPFFLDDANLRLSRNSMDQAAQALVKAGIGKTYVVACPVCSGGLENQDRSWPEFPALVDTLIAQGIPVVTCPGPGEEAFVRSWHASALCLADLPVSTYAAVLGGASCVISIDTGAGHIAASLGVPVISILGATSPMRWGIHGARTRILREWPNWPTQETVLKLMETCGLPSFAR